MIRRALSAIALLAAPAAAEEVSTPNINVAFGNTISVTYPDGRKAHLWLAADGAYTASGRRKTSSSGSWVLKGREICLRQQRPVPVPLTYCVKPPAGGGVGTSWEGKAVSGERIVITVLGGIVGR